MAENLDHRQLVTVEDPHRLEHVGNCRAGGKAGVGESLRLPERYAAIRALRQRLLKVFNSSIAFESDRASTIRVRISYSAIDSQ